MKKLIILSTTLLFVSCQKEWSCKSETIMNGQTTITYTDFTGSKDDMKDNEALGTFDKGWYSQTTKCVKK